MYIEYADYQALRYTTVPDSDFARYEAMAAATVRKYTQNRISSMKPPDDASANVKQIAEMNRYGMCELIDIHFVAANPQSDAAKAQQTVTSFSNGKYSETYLGNARTDAEIAAPDRMSIDKALETYFTPDQLWRAVGV